MAKYRIAKDGHPYLTHGYPVFDAKQHEDVRFSTYQVNTGGERVFDRAGFVDGDRVSQETFFALLLDGDLYNEARPNGIKPASIPNRVLAYMDDEVRTKHLDQINVSGNVFLSDIVETLKPHFSDPLDALSTASWLCIYRHWKTHIDKAQIR